MKSSTPQVFSSSNTHFDMREESINATSSLVNTKERRRACSIDTDSVPPPLRAFSTTNSTFSQAKRRCSNAFDRSAEELTSPFISSTTSHMRSVRIETEEERRDTEDSAAALADQHDEHSHCSHAEALTEEGSHHKVEHRDDAAALESARPLELSTSQNTRVPISSLSTSSSAVSHTETRPQADIRRPTQPPLRGMKVDLTTWLTAATSLSTAEAATHDRTISLNSSSATTTAATTQTTKGSLKNHSVQGSQGGALALQGMTTSSASAAAAARVLFLHDAEGESSRDEHGYNSYALGAVGIALESRGSRDDSLSRYSPSAVSHGTAAPDSVKEGYLLELLARATSPEHVDVFTSHDAQECEGKGDEGRDQVRPAVRLQPQQGRGKRVAGRRISRASSPTRRSARSEKDAHRRSEDADNSGDEDAQCAKSSSNFCQEAQDTECEQQEHQQSLYHALSSPSELLRLSFPSYTRNAFGEGADSNRSCRYPSRGATPSLPRSLFSDAHDCAAELPEQDLISIATAADTTALANRDFDTSSPAEGLDMSSFRTPLSPCPSSVAPPFSVFSGATTSRVTSPVSIPAKMMKQRQRDRVRVRQSSASQAGGAAAAAAAAAVPFGGGFAGNHQCVSGSLGYSSQRALRESFGSFTLASVTTNSLLSACASAADSGLRGVIECDGVLDRSEAHVAGVEGGEKSVNSPLHMGLGHAVDTHAKVDGRGRCASAEPVHDVDAQTARAGEACASTRSSATSKCPMHFYQRSGGMALSIQLPSPETSTPPSFSPCPSPRDATNASSGFKQSPASPSATGTTASPWLPRSASPPESGSLAAAASSTRPSCCASPWSPLSTRSTHVSHHTSTPTQLRPRSASPIRTGDGTSRNGAWMKHAGACGASTTRQTRCCSPPLPATSSIGSVSRISSPPHGCESNALTPLGEVRWSYHQYPQQQLHRPYQHYPSSGSANFTPSMGSEAASRHSGRPSSQSPLFTLSERKNGSDGVGGNGGGGLFTWMGQGSSPTEYLRFGAHSTAPNVFVETPPVREGDVSRSPEPFSSKYRSYPRLSVCSSMEYKPLKLSAASAPEQQQQQQQQQPPDELSTCSTPPPMPLTHPLISRSVSPRDSPDPHYADLHVGGGCTVSSACIDRYSPMQEIARAAARRSTRTTSINATANTTALTSRMSRQTLPLRRSAKLSHSPPQAFQASSHSIPATPATAGNDAPLWQPTSVVDTQGRSCELSGAVSAAASAQLPSPSPVPLTGQAPATLATVLGVQAGDVRRQQPGSPADHAPCHEGEVPSRSTCTEARSGEVKENEDESRKRTTDSFIGNDVNGREMGQEWHEIGSLYARHIEGSAVEGSAASAVNLGVEDGATGSHSTWFASSLQLVPPPPLVSLPRGATAAESSSPPSPIPVSSMEAASGQRSPLRCVEHNERGVASVSNRVGEEIMTLAARQPARAFHYAFSSLRGSRSRQEDGVSLTPELLIGKATGAEGRRTEEGEVSAASGARQVSGKGQIAEASAQRSTAGAEMGTDAVTFTCFGVFDGHCGDTVSSLASQYFPEHFENAVREYRAQWAIETNERDGQSAVPAASSFPVESAHHGAAVAGLSTNCTTAAGADPTAFQRVVSAALVQALVHLDLTLYDALHQKVRGRSSTQRRDAGSTASVAAFFKVPQQTSTDGTLSAGVTSEGVDGRDTITSVTCDDGNQRKHSAAELDSPPPVADTYRLCIANLGDSRAIVGNKHTRQLLLSTTDHRISACPSEEARIEAVGGVVELGRVDGSLDVTRGLGDYRYKVDPARWWAATSSHPPTASSASLDTAVSRRSPVHTFSSTSPTSGAALTALPITETVTSQGSTPSPGSAKTRAGSTSTVLMDTPVPDAPSTVRALQWQLDSSSTPVQGSLDENAVEEGDNRDFENKVNGAMNSCATTPPTSPAEAANGDGRGEDHKVARDDRGDAPVHAASFLDQMRRSIVNPPPPAAGRSSSVTPSSHHAWSTERELFTNPPPPRRATGSGDENSPTACPPRACARDTPHTTRSPLSTSTPASPLHPCGATALTGNAVSNIADVYEWEVHRGDVLIIASDGVWDFMSSEEVFHFICEELQDLGASDAEDDDENNDASTGSVAANVESFKATRTAGDEEGASVGVDDGGNTTDVQDSSAAPLVAAAASPSSSAQSMTASLGGTTPVGTQAQRCGTPLRAPREGVSQSTPTRQPTSLCYPTALCTPCADGGGGGATSGCAYEGTPGGGTNRGDASRSSAVQTAVRHLTEHVVNVLSGSDNTTAIVVVFR